MVSCITLVRLTAPHSFHSAPLITTGPDAGSVPPLPLQPDSSGDDQPGRQLHCLGRVFIQLPVNGALQSNAVNVTTSAFNVDQGDLKIDFKATQRTISAIVSRGLIRTIHRTILRCCCRNGYSTTPIYNTVGDWSRMIGNNMVNDARVGWSHVTLNSGNSLGIRAWGSSAIRSELEMGTRQYRWIARYQLHQFSRP